jgi:cellulose synthase/poly-beta-1,6-N-acetylglucosamine synthase-like glycosyltransferase
MTGMADLAAILLILACVSGALFAYPYTIYPVILRLLPRQPVRRGTERHSVSLLFCAFNEISSIDAKIANVRELKRRMPELEVLAFDDGSSDGTREQLARSADIVTLVTGEGRRGKAFGMKRLAKLASGDILVFTDANVILQADAIERLMPYYADPEVGGVCGTLEYITDPTSSATAELGARYWSLDECLRSLESETGNVMGADGSIFSIRRRLYPEFPDSVLDDFVVSLSVVFAGFRLIKAPDVLAFENSVAQPAEEFRRKIRIGTRAYHSHLWMRDRLQAMRPIDRFKYMSRKQLRWFGGAFLLFGAGSALAGLSLVAPASALAAAALGALIVPVALSQERGPLAKGGDVLRALTGTTIGVSRGMRGQTVQTWAPAKSR